MVEVRTAFFDVFMDSLCYLAAGQVLNPNDKAEKTSPGFVQIAWSIQQSKMYEFERELEGKNWIHFSQQKDPLNITNRIIVWS